MCWAIQPVSLIRESFMSEDVTTYRDGFERISHADVNYGDVVYFDNYEDGKYRKANPKISGPFTKTHGNGMNRYFENRDGHGLMHYPNNLLRKLG